jgi:hypothetical protein
MKGAVLRMRSRALLVAAAFMVTWTGVRFFSEAEAVADELVLAVFDPLVAI